MQTVMADLNRLTKDTRLVPRGRILATLLKVFFNPSIDERYRKMAEMILYANFVSRGGIDLPDDTSSALSEKAPRTNIEQDAASGLKNLLSYMVSGGRNERGNTGNTDSTDATDTIGSDSADAIEYSGTEHPIS